LHQLLNFHLSTNTEKSNINGLSGQLLHDSVSKLPLIDLDKKLEAARKNGNRALKKDLKRQ